MNREVSVYGSNTNCLINHVAPTEFYFTRDYRPKQAIWICPLLC